MGHRSRAQEKVPALNQAYSENRFGIFRITHEHVNMGLAIDVAGKDGARSLKVPSVKRADTMNFVQFLEAYNDLVKRARENKLTVPDFEGTTISLTNPGDRWNGRIDSEADAGAGCDHRHRRDRLSAGISRCAR